jgi:hypothetical protein
LADRTGVVRAKPSRRTVATHAWPQADHMTPPAARSSVAHGAADIADSPAGAQRKRRSLAVKVMRSQPMAILVRYR